MLKLKIILFGTSETGEEILQNGESKPLGLLNASKLYEHLKKEMTLFHDRLV